jgi:ribonuclease Z
LSVSAQDFKVTLLGTGSPIPIIDRFGPSTLVEAGREKLLIDCGRGASIRLWQLHIPLGGVTAVFLTHLHSDHVVGISDVWLTGWLPPPFGHRTEPFRISGPTGTREHATAKPAFGYRIDYGGRSVVLSGDTRVSENLIRFSKGTDLLVHEVAWAKPELIDKSEAARIIIALHTTPKQAGIVFSRVKPKLAVYSHIVLFTTDPNVT